MKLLVGLGNPGAQYERTRHNVGFLVADEAASRLGATFSTEKFGARIAEGTVGGEKVWVMKPQTFMNASGEAVGAAARFWKATAADVVVIHDDLELDPFRLQLKVGGGHSGHNGLKSVQAHLGTPDYARVRCGIGRPPPRVDPADWVLGKWKKGEEEQVKDLVERAATAALAVLEKGPAKAMNEFNRRR